MWIAPLLLGFTLSGGLIVAIGAQNLFVLQQGLLRRHVGPVVLFCVACDVTLIALGVLGLSKVLAKAPMLAPVLTLCGVAFLAWYGVSAFRRAASTATAPASRVLTLRAALGQAAAFTLLNPHVYLDTVLFVGSLGAAQPALLRPWFILGAGLASTSWFGALGYGARLMAPLFARPKAWRVMDAVVGVVMLGLAAGLLVSLVHPHLPL